MFFVVLFICFFLFFFFQAEDGIRDKLVTGVQTCALPILERRKKCDQVLELVDLGYKRDALVTSLSRGMTQRLGLARVLLHEPQVLLLDEPASGLDPRARIEMRGLIKELRNMGKTILLSSHILPELADICNKIGIIERGKLLFDGDVQAAIQKVRQRTRMTVAVGDGRNEEAKPILERE